MLPPDVIAEAVLDVYGSLPRSCRPQPSGSTPTYTILAGIVLVPDSGLPTVISLGTGSKVLPSSKLPPSGDVLHDSHAEVIARRGAIKWFMEEIRRGRDDWVKPVPGGRLALREDVTVAMYISCLPCGDASMSYLAATQDPEMASLKDATGSPALSGLARGRDGYANYGALRTKPGRADSPPTLSMSCSDKIAAWTVLGIQGALLSSILDPVYLDQLVISGIPVELRDRATVDCLRAFRDRLGQIGGLPRPFRQNVPQVDFSDASFVFSKESLSAQNPSITPLASSDSVSWVADAGLVESLVGGIRRGASLKSRKGLQPRGRSRICKLSLFNEYARLRHNLGLTVLSPDTTYRSAKLSASGSYDQAKTYLRSGHGPFADWMISGTPWEAFDLEGNVAAGTVPRIIGTSAMV
ncbi:adenosine deaminase/editase [Calocera cornea HHB12733]|uniref:Adenosine deaminase/editase n=1 Tax=Calocera cornea HHB12733 TaxID=1353952 RepID=A0A165EBU1_9BASI|nr:adenosine deaminase/editase [Calocera cornea HHB12733]